MDTPTIATRIAELNVEVEQYRTVKTGVAKSPFAFTFNSKFTYYLVPIMVLFLLIFFKPGFIKYTDIDDKGVETRKLGYKKLLTAWLIITSLLVIGLFGFNYKKASKE